MATAEYLAAAQLAITRFVLIRSMEEAIRSILQRKKRVGSTGEPTRL
jgi:hypothetical protein